VQDQKTELPVGLFVSEESQGLHSVVVVGMIVLLDDEQVDHQWVEMTVKVTCHKVFGGPADGAFHERGSASAGICVR
jgi:hypothetical protein